MRCSRKSLKILVISCSNCMTTATSHRFVVCDALMIVQFDLCTLQVMTRIRFFTLKIWIVYFMLTVYRETLADWKLDRNKFLETHSHYVIVFFVIATPPPPIKTAYQTCCFLVCFDYEEHVNSNTVSLFVLRKALVLLPVPACNIKCAKS